jgi:hypothetical protein
MDSTAQNHKNNVNQAPEMHPVKKNAGGEQQNEKERKIVAFTWSIP